MRVFRYALPVLVAFTFTLPAVAKVRGLRDSVRVSQNETESKVTATSSPIPAPTPAPTPVAAQPTPAPAPPPPASKKAEDRSSAVIKQECEKHFPGMIQSEVRAACTSSSVDFEKLGKDLVGTRCRLNYGEEPRLVMACLIGANITNELAASHDDFRTKLKLCSEFYPVHNEIDAFLQESCLTGIHLPEVMNVAGKARFEACSQITPERSFIGPCAVGLSLAHDKMQAGKETQVAPAELNKLCGQYFNLRQFHKGYRACLNARSLVPDLAMKPSEAVKTVIGDCSNILSEANSDTERAACFVGLNIYRHLMKQEDIVKRFQKCGENQVTYADRDVLACLTAASLLDFTDKGGAERGCKDVFKEGKSKSRGECLSSLTLF